MFIRKKLFFHYNLNLLFIQFSFKIFLKVVEFILPVYYESEHVNKVNNMDYLKELFSKYFKFHMIDKEALPNYIELIKINFIEKLDKSSQDIYIYEYEYVMHKQIITKIALLILLFV